jgi:hypothetical protein
MNKSRTRFLYIGLTVIVFFSLSTTRSAESTSIKQVVCTGKVIDEQDRPLAGVKVSLHEMVYDEATYIYNPKLLGETQTQTNGAFSFNETVKDNRYRYGYIVADKEGQALGFDNWSMRDGDKELEIKLGPPKELTGIVVDEKDIPIPGARVMIPTLILGEGRERLNLNSLVVPELLTTNTDATGTFTFTRIPAGATAEFLVEKSDRATISTYIRTGMAYQKLNFTEGQENIKLILPVEAKIKGVIVEKTTGKPVGGVELRYTSGQELGYYRPKPLVSKEDGTFSIEALVATRYLLELVQPSEKLPDWVADPVEVITEKGKTKSGVKIELSKGGVLEVKVIDAVNKEPVEEAYVIVNNQVSNRSASRRSDEEGMARMRLMPGDYQLTYINKQGYSRQRLQDTVTIEDGQTQRLEYELVGMPKITGVVSDEKGEPIEGVELEICPSGGREEAVSDAEGKFEVIYDLGSWPGSRTPVMYLVGRHQERNLAAAVQLDEDTRELEMKLEPAVTLFGRIVDPNGQGLVSVDVRTMMHAPGWGSTIGRKPATTDNEGKYEIKAIPPDRPYNVYARADGYGESRGEEINAETAVDRRLDMGELTLAVANLSVSGVVVDNNDVPVAGASVSCYGDNQPHRNTRTDTEGKFTLNEVCAGKLRVSANKTAATRLYGSIETDGGATDVRIVISQRSSSTRYEPRRPPSFVGRPMPKLNELGIGLSEADMDGKILLVCFWDMEQRPSRRCVTQLAKQVEQLKKQGVIVVTVHASKMDESALNQWAKKYKIPFPVGMVQSNYEKARFSWGIRSLPWLILTDRTHIIRSTGFRFDELNAKIKEMSDEKR